MTTTRYGSNDGAASYDTFVLAAEPSKPHNKLTYALIGDGIAEYLWNTGLAGIPKGATVNTATFSVFSAGDWFGSVELSCTAADGPWAGHTATWNNRPGIAGPTDVVTHSPGVEGVEYAFDVTGPVQTWVSNGGGNGFKVRRTDGGAGVRIWQRESASPDTPVLIVTWTAPGQKPDNLSPNGVVGVNKPTISGLPKSAANVRVDVDASSSGFGSPDYSTGTIPVTAPGEIDLNTTSYPGGPLGTDQWYEVSTQGPGGGWSVKSDPLFFNFVSNPLLTITGPSPLYPFVTDPSPTATWAMSAQVAFHLWLTSPGDGDRTTLYDTGMVSGDAGLAHEWTIPHHDDDGKVILKDRNVYKLHIRGYDGLDRVAVPGYPVYSYAEQEFTFTEVGGVPPFDFLTAVQVSNGPTVRLDFGSLAGTEDQITIWRDEQVLESGIAPSDVDNPDTGAYTYIDWKVPPGEHTYYAERVVNGDSSVPGPHAIVNMVVECHWLVNADEGWSVKLHNVGGISGLTITDQATRVRPLGSRKTVKRTTAQGYFEGPVWGWLLNDDADDPDGRTADDYFLDLRRMANSPSTPVTLAYTNFAFPVLIGDHTPLPLEDVNGVDGMLRVEFNVLQQDDWTIFDTPPASDLGMPDAVDIYTYEAFSAAHVLTTGDADITATSGTPTVQANDGTLHTDGEKFWNGGSITRSVIDGTTGGDDVYARVPVKAGFGGSSLFTLKNPAGANPADIRLRSGGTIDIHAFDGSIPDTASLQWTQAQWLRGSLAWTWESDSTLGASMGWLTLSVALYFGRNVENTVADDIMYARYPSLEPVNETNGNPSGGVDFEVGRRWPYRFLAYPYGEPPPPLAGEPGNGLWLGDAQQTTFEVAAYSNSYLSAGIDVPIAPTDLIGLNRSAVVGMTSVTSYTAAVPDAEGWNRWSVTGLAANTTYFWQPTVNGTPFGQVCQAKTYKAAGTAQTVKLAISSCKENAPASTMCAVDIATFAPDRYIDLGDLSYPGNLSGVSQVPVKANWARQITDPAMQMVAALCSHEYMTSDHDVNGANGKSNQPNYHDAVSQTSMDAWVAVIPARLADVRSPIRARYRSSVEGNYRYVWVDTRSWDKSDGITDISDDHDSSKTMLGATQLAWLKAEIDAAAAAHQFVFLFTDPAWNGRAEIAEDGKISLSTSDKWPAYGYERDLISDYAYSKLGYLVTGVKRVNMLICFGDTHALQQDDGTNEKNNIASICCGPFAQNVHANFVDAYQRTFPANAGDHVGKQPTQMSYHQVTATESPAGTVNLAIVGRDCTPKHTGTPLTPPGFSVTYGPYTL